MPWQLISMNGDTLSLFMRKHGLWKAAFHNTFSLLVLVLMFPKELEIFHIQNDKKNKMQNPVPAYLIILRLDVFISRSQVIGNQQ